MDIERLYQFYLDHPTVTTDSRTAGPGSLFFAFRGDHFDASDFIPQALASGAALCVTNNPAFRGDSRCLVVDDVLHTLQQLAACHRAHLGIPIVGITGTNGKTTTKELVSAVLAQRFRTACTQGNHNNHLGVPLTLLSIPADTEIAVVEMGANHPGEIEALCRIADPTCGLITNVGLAHLAGFGSLEGVIRTKTELYRHLAARRGLVFVNADNDTLLAQAQALAAQPGEGLSIVAYGSRSNASPRGTCLGGTPYMKFYFESGDSVCTVQTHLLGTYNFDNAMAAVAIGLHFGVDPYAIKEALEQYTPSNHRSQLKRTATNTLYLDCYNANPTSMAAACNAFAATAASPRTAIIGGMKELGDASLNEHRKLVRQLEASRIDNVWLVGPEFDGLDLPHGWLHFADVDEAAAHLGSHPLQGHTVLVKGSNSNRLWLLEERL